MRHERREALETNELADRLGRAIEAARPYANYIFIGLTVVAAAIVAVVAVSGRSARAKASGWEAFFQANSPEQLQAVAQNYSDSPVAAWAVLQAAQQTQAIGASQLYDRRSEAVVRLKEAVKLYEQAAREHASVPVVAERAALGIAACYESMSDLSAARDAYQKVADKYPGREVAQEAADRLAQLNRPEATAFYEALANYKPPPDVKPPPSTSTAPTQPPPSLKTGAPGSKEKF